MLKNQVSCIWQAGPLVLVFGGAVGRAGARTNELLWMTTERMEWHLQAWGFPRLSR